MAIIYLCACDSQTGRPCPIQSWFQVIMSVLAPWAAKNSSFCRQEVLYVISIHNYRVYPSNMEIQIPTWTPPPPPRRIQDYLGTGGGLLSKFKKNLNNFFSLTFCRQDFFRGGGAISKPSLHTPSPPRAGSLELMIDVSPAPRGLSSVSDIN